jgi:hypothetical protein
MVLGWAWRRWRTGKLASAAAGFDFQRAHAAHDPREARAIRLKFDISIDLSCIFSAIAASGFARLLLRKRPIRSVPIRSLPSLDAGFQHPAGMTARWSLGRASCDYLGRGPFYRGGGSN